MAKKSVFCISSTEAQASEIISQLRLAGFSNNDISALLPDKTGTNDFAHEHHTKAPEGAATGGLIGALLCAGVGWLAGLGVLPFSGLRPLLTVGPILAAMSGAGVGAGLGGMVGAFLGMGIPEYEAKRYRGKIREGNILISVHCENDGVVERAKEIFQRTGARHIATSEEAAVRQPGRRPTAAARPS